MTEPGALNKADVGRAAGGWLSLHLRRGAEFGHNAVMRLAKFWVGVVAALVVAGKVAAVEIMIVNAGFESPATGPGTFVTNAPPTGWSAFGSVESFEARAVGVLNPNGTTLFSSVPEGNNVGVVFLRNSDQTFSGRAAGLQQTLSDTLQLNTSYTLSVAVGNIGNDSAEPHNAFNFSGFPGYRIELLAGGNVIAFNENTVAPGEGGFLTTTLNYNVGSLHANAGGALGIRLINLDAAAGIEVNFDDVRLTAVAIPEVSTGSLWLGAAALGALGVGRRYRRRHT